MSSIVQVALAVPSSIRSTKLSASAYGIYIWKPRDDLYACMGTVHAGPCGRSGIYSNFIFVDISILLHVNLIFIIM